MIYRGGTKRKQIDHVANRSSLDDIKLEVKNTMVAREIHVLKINKIRI
jgi:hypothetical protein